MEVMLGIEWVIGLTASIFIAIMGIYVFLMRHERELGEIHSRLEFILKNMGLLNPEYLEWKESQEGKRARAFDEKKEG